MEKDLPSEADLSITDSRFDRELAFTDADHYISVATKSGVPISSGTPVHKHSEASEMAEQQKAEMRRSAIDRYADTQTQKAWESQGKVEEDENEAASEEDSESLPPKMDLLSGGECEEAPYERKQKDEGNGGAEEAERGGEKEDLERKRLTLTNLDTGEEFIIGENDPDFEWDTFELEPGDDISTSTGAKSNADKDDSAKALGSAMEETIGGSMESKEGTTRRSSRSGRKTSWWTRLKKFFSWRKSKRDGKGTDVEGGGTSGDADGSSGAADGSKKSAKERRRTPFTQLSSFKFRKELGKGAFGRVLLAEAKADGSLYALKIISKKNMRQSDRRQAKTERDILHAMSQTDPHPFTTGLKFAFQSENNLYLGMTFIPGGTLRELIKREGHLPLEWVLLYTAELVLAISHMHSLRMLYRDIKPHNVMLDGEGHITIIDFGLSKQEISSPRGAMSLVGTPDYSAPEVLKTGVHQIEANRAMKKEEKRRGRNARTNGTGNGANKGARRQSPDVGGTAAGNNRGDGANPEDGVQRDSNGAPVGYGKAADWWSLGVMVYEMISGTPAFRGNDLRQTYQKVLFAPLEFAPAERFPEGDAMVASAMALIKGLLERDPSQRLGSSDNPPSDIMSHPFFGDLDWEAVFAREKAGPWVPDNPYAAKEAKKERRASRKDKDKDRDKDKGKSKSSKDTAEPQAGAAEGDAPPPVEGQGQGPNGPLESPPKGIDPGRLVSVDSATPFVLKPEDSGGDGEGDGGEDMLGQKSRGLAAATVPGEASSTPLTRISESEGRESEGGSRGHSLRGASASASASGADRGGMGGHGGTEETTPSPDKVNGNLDSPKKREGEDEDEDEDEDDTSSTDEGSTSERTSSASSDELLSMRDSVLSPTTVGAATNRLADWSFIDDKMLLAASKAGGKGTDGKADGGAAGTAKAKKAKKKTAGDNRKKKAK